MKGANWLPFSLFRAYGLSTFLWLIDLRAFSVLHRGHPCIFLEETSKKGGA